MWKHLILRKIKPVVVRVYVDGRFELLPEEPHNPTIAEEYIKVILSRSGAVSQMEPGDYRFEYKKIDRGDATFDMTKI